MPSRFLLCHPYHRFINFMDLFNEPAFGFTDPIIFLFPMPLIPPLRALGLFLCYTVTVLYVISTSCCPAVSKGGWF